MNQEQPYDIEQLILLLKNGDESAFATLYNIYGTRLYQKLVRLTKSPETAKELLQEAFIKIWNNKANLDPEQSFRSYLFKIAENLAYDFFRKASRDSKLHRQILAVTKEQYHYIEEAIFKKENALILEKAIEALPQQRKEVFRLCKVEGKSYEEVSQILNISTSTISDHIVKANKFLRQYLMDDNRLSIILLIYNALLTADFMEMENIPEKIFL